MFVAYHYVAYIVLLFATTVAMKLFTYDIIWAVSLKNVWTLNFNVSSFIWIEKFLSCWLKLSHKQKIKKHPIHVACILVYFEVMYGKWNKHNDFMLCILVILSKGIEYHIIQSC